MRSPRSISPSPSWEFRWRGHYNFLKRDFQNVGTIFEISLEKCINFQVKIKRTFQFLFIYCRARLIATR